MPIIRHGIPLGSEAFASEQQLEDVLAAHPELIREEGMQDPEVKLVQRQVSLRDAGIADLLFIDHSGLPIVVEVKLRANGQSRREVAAQVFDYVSSLSLLTSEELDELVGGALQTAVNSFSESRSDDAHDRWRACSANLRAGKARVIVAVDEAPDELTRIMRFLNAHSDLDVRLLAIQRYPDSSGESTYLASIVSDKVNFGGSPASRQSTQRRPNDSFAAVIEAYSRVASAGFEATGSAAKYRQLNTPGWPRGKVHYEFMDRGDAVGVDIHFEPKRYWRDDVLKGAAQLVSTVSKLLPAARVTWESPWTYGHRLSALMNTGEHSPEAIAEAMKTVIAGTRTEVQRLLDRQQR